METIIPWVAPLVGLFIILPVAWRSRPTSAGMSAPRRGPVDRLRLIAEGAEVVAVLAIVSFIGTWTPWSILGWYALVSVAAFTAAGLSLAAVSAPWTAPDAAPRKRILVTALSVAFSAAFVAVPLAL